MKVYRSDFYPLTFVLFYIGVGILLSVYGPIRYLGYDKLSVVTYILLFMVLFSVGYVIGAIEDEKPFGAKSIGLARHKFQKILFWIKFSIIIAVVAQLAILIVSIFTDSINLSILKLGEAYTDAYTDYERGSGQVSGVFIVKTITYIPYIVALILGVYYFKDLPRLYKMLVVFCYVLTILLETIGYGKQKQLGDMLVILIVILLLRSNLHIKNERKRTFRKIFIICLIGFMSLITILHLRYSALGIDASNIDIRAHSLMQYDTEHIIFDAFGDKTGFAVAAFTGYLSQGYYGLSLSMHQSFKWTYFVGNSYSLSVFLNRFLGMPVDYHDTYPYRASLRTGWDDSKWSTAFSWFAGDFTFIGTLFVFAVVAFFYAKVWREAYRYQNPISVVLLVMLTIGVIYIPANNQLLHTPGSFMAVLYFFVLWAIKHKRFNFYRNKPLCGNSYNYSKG